ncbi:MAG TPA: histidine--tRNA ligase [Desulfobulbaceae bacterium]|nr:histidine--tRNA ligase [Desulfobulbaceae bacterium]
MNIKAVQGFKDILPDEVVLWQHVEQRARDIFHRFGFGEIRLPIIEETELFARSIGQTTDIVEKEMYTFVDKGLTLRPEATASLLRAFIEHGLHVLQPVQKLYTMGPMFRHERPQKGRLRQFHQLDAEIIGATEPAVDAELMAMGNMLLAELGLQAKLEINSLGCPACRPSFREKLVTYLRRFAGEMCPDCQRRLESNPLRSLDCKSQHCKKVVAGAPSILDSLCPPCSDHFARVREGLEHLSVPYSVNHCMVRGLDYYTRTTFEFTTASLGAQSAVGAGGRYDGLIAQLGGASLPGIGFALGVERIILLLQQQEGPRLTPAAQAEIFVAALGENGGRYSQLLVHLLRQGGVKAAMDYSGRSLKAQMKQAGRLGARFALIVGDNELSRQSAVLRDMDSQSQEDFGLQDSPQSCADRLRTLVTTRLPASGRPA